ncbi:MAG: arylsulfatase, partial [Rubripirellula sp.]
RKTNAMACLTDLYSTLQEITEQPRQATGGEDGFSLVKVFDGADSSGRDVLISHSIGGLFSIRKENWKLCLCAGSGGWSDPREPVAKQQGLPEMQLFDLSKDRSEQSNLIAEHPEKADELLKILKDQVDAGRCTPGESTSNDREVTFLP